MKLSGDSLLICGYLRWSAVFRQTPY